MEPQFKRRRVSSYDDPSLELHELRGRNDLRLKSTFESIFDKYSKDFSKVGDEIDLDTGQIVVNNGHILGMRDEVDVGYDENESDADELANGILSGIEAADQPIQYRRRNLDLGSEEQDRITVIAASDDPYPTIDDSDSLLGDIQDDGLVKYMGDTAETQTDHKPGNEQEVFGHGLGLIRSNTCQPPSDKASSDSLQSSGGQHVSQLVTSITYPYQSVTEPAWRAPPLPVTISLSGGKPISETLLHGKDIERQRSLSPTAGSLWAPERTPGRPRKDLGGSRRSKPAFAASAPVARSSREEVQLTQKRLSTPSGRKGPLSSPQSRSYSENTKRRRHTSSEMPTKSVLKGRLRKGQKSWTAEEDELLLHLRGTAHLDYEELKRHFPGRKSSSIKHRWYYAVRDPPWTAAEDQLLWHLKTNTELTERQMVPHFSGRKLHQIRGRWTASQGFARQEQAFMTTSPAAATLEDDQWLRELLANSAQQPSETFEQFPAKPSQNPLQHKDELLSSLETNGEGAIDEHKRDSRAPVGHDTGPNLSIDIADDAGEIKEEPVKPGPLLSSTRMSAARESTKKQSPAAANQSPHPSDEADAVMTLYSSPLSPSANPIHRSSKRKRGSSQSHHLNASISGPGLKPKTSSSTPSQRQRHRRSTKPTPATSLSSMLAYDSEEDELSRSEKIVKTPKAPPFTTPLSTSRKCGNIGFRCARSVCLRCT